MLPSPSVCAPHMLPLSSVVITFYVSIMCLGVCVCYKILVALNMSFYMKVDYFINVLLLS